MPYIAKRRISAKKDRTEHNRQRNDKWSHYYSNRTYRRLRDWYKKSHPLCEDCIFEGRSVAADHVHHIVPFSFFDNEADRIKALTDPDNLCCLCEHHHAERHKHLKRPDNFEETEYYKKIHSAQ